MKKFFLCVGLILISAGFAMAQVSPGGTLYVTSKTLALKSSMGMLSATTGTLNYADKVTVISVNGKNIQVRSADNPSITGWAPAANFTARQIASTASTTTSAREVALAGKGFNQEVENVYKQQGNLNYADVDKIEKLTFTEAELIRFLREGNLSLGE